VLQVCFGVRRSLRSQLLQLFDAFLVLLLQAAVHLFVIRLGLHPIFSGIVVAGVSRFETSDGFVERSNLFGAVAQLFRFLVKKFFEVVALLL
jgi:hypothetical protein